MNFLDVKTDYAFKKVFGSENSKEILMSFLNSLIDFPEGGKVESLEILDPYQVPELKGMKDSYVDVKAVLDNKTNVIIEMQVLNVESFEKRILYNAAKKYSSQLKKGEAYNLLNPVIALTIVDFMMFPEFKKVVSHFQLMEKKEFISYSDDVELIFIELPKFKKELEDLSDIKEEWIYFIKNAGDLTVVPENVDDKIKQALEIVNEASLSEEELEVQHKRKDFIWLQKSSIEKAKKEGIEQGIEQGIELMTPKLKQAQEEKQKAQEREKIMYELLKNSGLSDEEINKQLGL